MRVKDAIKHFTKLTNGGLVKGRVDLNLEQYGVDYTIKSAPLHELETGGFNLYSDNELKAMYGYRGSTMIEEDYFPNVIVSNWGEHKESLFIDTAEQLPSESALVDTIETDFYDFIEYLDNMPEKA